MTSRRLWLAVMGAALAAACSSGTPGTSGSHGASASPSAPVVAPGGAPPTAPPSPSASTVPASTPSSVPAAPTGVPAATDLTFTGSMSGRVQSATSAGLCGRAPGGFAAELRFALSGQSYVLSIAILDYGGPGTYTIPPERVSVRPGQPGSGALLPAVSGRVAVDASERSGQIDAAVADGGTHLSGTWACG